MTNVSRNITKERLQTDGWMDGPTDGRTPKRPRLCTIFAVCLFQVYREAYPPVGKKATASLSFCSSVHGLVSDKYTVFNSVHPIKGKCIVERMRGNKTEAEGIGHQIEKSKVPRNWAHGAGEEGNRQSSLAPWEQMEVLVLYWQCEACPREDGRGLRA